MFGGQKRWLTLLLTGFVASSCFIGQWHRTFAAASPSTRSGRTAKLSFPETRLRLLVRFANIFACPPPNEQPASAPVPDIRNDAEAFHAILNHLGLKDGAELTHDQSLLIYREYEKMRAIRLTTQGGDYTFTVDVRDQDADFRIDGTVDSQGRIRVLQQHPVVINCPK
jgi:hypothetical protein